MISVVVPVYNTAPYLCECVDSVLKQSYSDFELILVDDGSQDRSAEICRRIASKDRRIRFLQQKHKGVSAARNRAMDEAAGDYLFFADSDDAIHPELLQTLFRLIESGRAAVALSGYCRVSSEDLCERLFEDSCKKGEATSLFVSNREATQEFAYSRLGSGLFSAIGGKLIRREAVGPLRFDESLCNGEDTKFLYQLFDRGAEAVVLEQDWYYYRLHFSNASREITAKAYRDRYKCGKYICLREAGNGRAGNSGRIGKILLYDLLKWYRTSRRDHDADLKKALEEIAERERKEKSFKQFFLRDRVRFHLAFSCYPLYRLLEACCGPLRRWKGKGRAKNG